MSHLVQWIVASRILKIIVSLREEAGPVEVQVG